MAVQVQDLGVVASCIQRNYAVFLPDIWGPDFFNSLSDSKAMYDSSLREEHDGLKQEIMRLLKSNTDEPSQKLKLIDDTQRLGVAYHFKTEIEDELNKIFNINSKDQNDLHVVALRFRLLRQQGIKVSCDVFEEFKDGEGKFKESLIQDVEGMLSFYEAAFLGIRGEDILDEAIAFTTANLKKILPQLTPNYLAEEVKNALNRPIRKCLPRIAARQFIPIYEQHEMHNKILLKFAKLDFNMVQDQHRKELKEIIEWWKTLDVKTNFPYARDRIVLCYFWNMGVYFEPKYHLARKMLTKAIAMSSIIDDTYDNYGTYEELVLFTEAIERWDVEPIGSLPECMKLVVHSLNDVYNEMDEITTKDGRPYSAYYAKESMKRLTRYYLLEAKWREEKYIPTTEEHLEISGVSTGFPMLATTSFLGMGEIATQDAFEWITDDPKILEAANVVCRLMDDIVIYEFERERDHVASSIECYAKQHNIEEEKVIKLFRKEIGDAWKDMNEERLNPLPAPMDLLERVMNLSRVMDIIYKDDDGYRKPHLMKDYVISLIKDRVN